VEPGSREADGRTIAIVPVRALEGAKSRLGDVLDAEERRDLVVGLLLRTLDAVRGARAIDGVIVVSGDEEVLDLARGRSATALRQLGGGLNAALEQARTVAIELGASRVVVVPGDLPLVGAGALDDLLSPVDASPMTGDGPGTPRAGRLVVLVTDRHRRGTNALVLRPPDVIPFAFGGDSRLAHAALARDAGARYLELGGPLDLDLDTPEDLLLADSRAAVVGLPGGHPNEDQAGARKGP
jgi:2-phospho-L-lactate guanylyltransferase